MIWHIVMVSRDGMQWEWEWEWYRNDINGMTAIKFIFYIYMIANSNFDSRVQIIKQSG